MTVSGKPPSSSRLWIPRFSLTERLSHWSFASFFLIAFLTGLVMWLPPTRELLGGDRLQLSHLHAGLGYLMVLTPLILFLALDRRRLAAGLREVDRWDADDRRWFWAAMRGGTLRGAEMPPQRRLNAGQKFNAVLVAAIVLGFLVTGSILLARAHVPAWIVSRALWLHGFLAVLGIAVFLGHLGHVFLTSHGRDYLHAMIRGTLSFETATQRHSKWEAVTVLDREPHSEAIATPESQAASDTVAASEASSCADTSPDV